ncbi:MAG TPA: LysE family translocator [Gammaproteobacteria bacterium]|jgi:threonine/homoserine/homoserine lactone efflux protein|nr:LysE family translocator [Gammaproteobacteria bacterium]
MPSLAAMTAFGIISFGFAITPGPNMMYILSRSLSQGAAAGLMSLVGVAAGFVVYLLLSAFGITAVVMAVPVAYDALRIAGAAYLLYLAWGVLKPGGRSPFETRTLPPHSDRRLIAMGFMTNLLNPKAAMLYLALLPQFIDPRRGSVLPQALVLGCIHITLSLLANGSAALAAGGISRFLAKSPVWLRLQRWFMGTVLTALAVNMLRESRR